MRETQAKPRPRYLRFGLRTAFVVLTMFSLWLGWQAKIARDRREALTALHAAKIPVVAASYLQPKPFEVLPSIPFYRYWFGDFAVGWIAVPPNYPGTVQLQHQFPEAKVVRIGQHWFVEKDGSLGLTY